MALSLPRTCIQSLVRRDPRELAFSHSGPKQACEDTMRRQPSANQEAEGASAPPGPRALHSSGSAFRLSLCRPRTQGSGGHSPGSQRGWVGHTYAKRSLSCRVSAGPPHCEMRSERPTLARLCPPISSAVLPPLSPCSQPHPWATTQP